MSPITDRVRPSSWRGRTVSCSRASTAISSTRSLGRYRGGKADTGETPEVAAIRECLEETGVRCQGLAPLISFLPGLDTLDNPTHIFFTSAFETVVDRPPHAAEVKETHWMPLHRCLDMINAGKIVDSLSLIALLSYARQQDTA